MVDSMGIIISIIGTLVLLGIAISGEISSKINKNKYSGSNKTWHNYLIDNKRWR